MSYTQFLTLLLCTVLMVFSPTAKSDTYPVTSSSCNGANSISEAIAMANANPGVDTIEIEGGLSIYGCDGADTPNPFHLEITDSVKINGNFARFYGQNEWLSAGDILSPINADTEDCPRGIIIGESRGLFQIGAYEQDNSGINVEIFDLFLSKFSMIAEVEDNATLQMTRVFADHITSLYACSRPAVLAKPGADVTLTNSRIQIAKLWSPLPPLVVGLLQNTGPSAVKASTLTINNSLFDNNFQKAAIAWSGDVNITSSQFHNSGGLFLRDGSFTFNNSVLYQEGRINGRDRDWVYVDNGTLAVSASTISFGHTSCDKTLFESTCVNENWPWGDFTYRSPIMAFNDGAIVFVSSIVQVRLPNYGEEQQPLLTAYDSSSIFADEYTFIQPTNLQTAEALKTLTQQPNLITTSQAMPTVTNVVELLFSEAPQNITPLLGDGVTLGPLIDIVPNAANGETNELVDIKGNPIENDVLGNARYDENGRRNAGAIQTHTAPYLTLLNIADTEATLSWTTPRALASGDATHYDVCFALLTAMPHAPQDGTCPGTLDTMGTTPTNSGSIRGLVNGTPYAVVVRVVNSTNVGPWSNLVEVTSYGELAAPAPSAVPGDHQVDVFWAPVDGKGRTIARYIVSWKKLNGDGHQDALTVNVDASGYPDPNTSSKPGFIQLNITDFAADDFNDYEFSVIAQTIDGTSSPAGNVIAGPCKPIMLNKNGGSMTLPILCLLLLIAGCRQRRQQ
ncbi:fibronectin type III domain-containing protein [Shewanella sp. YIC-542]|uniref:fibronectin type III domain-containing protein n=1 Tax=Shewanella mytili TaxID=3377111 RepID=UPI00398EE0DC